MRPPISQLLINRPAMQPSTSPASASLLTGVVRHRCGATKQFGLHPRRRGCRRAPSGSAGCGGGRITGDGGTACRFSCDLSGHGSDRRWSKTSKHRRGRYPDPTMPAGRSGGHWRVAGTLARRRAHHGAQLLCPALQLIRGLVPGCSTWRQPYHQCRHLGRVVEASPLFSVYNIKGRTVGGEPGSSKPSGVVRACIRHCCTTRWWHLDGAPAKAYDGLPALTAAEAAGGVTAARTDRCG